MEASWQRRESEANYLQKHATVKSRITHQDNHNNHLEHTMIKDNHINNCYMQNIKDQQIEHAKVKQ